MTESITSLISAYRTDRERYDAVATFTANAVQGLLQSQGIHALTSGRAKDVASFAKKAYKRQLEGKDVAGIQDRAGARAVVRYPAQVAQAKQIITEALPGVECDDKSETIEANVFSYIGVHWDVVFPVTSWPGSEAFDGLYCELQLQTQAQRLWADLAHDLVYKSAGSSSPSRTLERRSARVMALCELVDSEFDSVRRELMSDASSPTWQLLAALETPYFEFHSLPYDKELSLLVLDKLHPLAGDLATVGDRVADFVHTHEAKLRMITEDFASAQGAIPLLFQPEAFLIFECLERDKDALQEVWAKLMAQDQLNEMAIAWGQPLD